MEFRPKGSSILYRALAWSLEGKALLFGFNFLKGVFIAKDDEPDDHLQVIRAAPNTRPVGLNNTDSQVLFSVCIKPLTRMLPAFIQKAQTGFVPSRNFGVDALELDTEARITSMQPEARSRSPFLASFDYGQAFPSMSQFWIFLVLGQLNLPGPLLCFLKMIYSQVFCFGQTGDALFYMYLIQSGIAQGCPASGILYAIASHPFAAHLHDLIEARKLGIYRLCADDAG